MRIDFDRFKKEPAPAEPRGQATQDTESFASELQQVVEMVQPGNLVHWYSDGDWSMWQLLEAVLKKTSKPAVLHISSYAFSETSARMLARMKNENMIQGLCCLLDNRTDTRTPASLQLLRGICDDLFLISTHAKVTLIDTGNDHITITGSANYTENKRYEAGTISSNLETYDFHKNWMIKEFRNAAFR